MQNNEATFAKQHSYHRYATTLRLLAPMATYNLIHFDMVGIISYQVLHTFGKGRGGLGGPSAFVCILGLGACILEGGNPSRLSQVG